VCGGKLVNKGKLEAAVVDQIQQHVLSRDNVKKYIELAVAQERAADVMPTAEEATNRLAIEDAETRLRRWEDALERGLLSPEEASRRIKEIRAELDALIKNQARLQRQKEAKAKVHPIPTQLMDAYIGIMQARLKSDGLGNKREFLRELLKEVKIDGNQVTVTYRLPLDVEQAGSEKKFFTLSQMVEAGGIEPPSEGFPSDMTTCLAAVLISLLEPPTAGSRGAIRFGSRPHTLRQENRPIPLNDVLSDPAGESR